VWRGAHPGLDWSVGYAGNSGESGCGYLLLFLLGGGLVIVVIGAILTVGVVIAAAVVAAGLIFGLFMAFYNLIRTFIEAHSVIR
jgi:hypothetical protein